MMSRRIYVNQLITCTVVRYAEGLKNEKTEIANFRNSEIGRNLLDILKCNRYISLIIIITNYRYSSEQSLIDNVSH